MENMRAYHEVLVFKIVSIREKVGRYRAACRTYCCSIFSDRVKRIVGAANAQGPPVPIPNTEVKLCSAEDTLLETVRENRSGPTSVEESKRTP